MLAEWVFFGNGQLTEGAETPPLNEGGKHADQGVD